MRKILFLWLLAYLYSIADATIFVYHRFGDDRHPSTNTSIEQLRKDFEYIKNNGYTVVPLSKVVELIQKKQEVPDKWVVITIDDNYKSFYANGLKVFKEYGYPFTLFVYIKAHGIYYSINKAIAFYNMTNKISDVLKETIFNSLSNLYNAQKEFLHKSGTDPEKIAYFLDMVSVELSGLFMNINREKAKLEKRLNPS
mgnify:CR=1 FL=1